jgi:hypothetical protein
MSKQTLTINNWSGGISPYTKSGLQNSCRFSRYLDIFSDNDSVSLNPKAVKISSSTITDLPLFMVEGSPFDTNKYVLGDTGKLYKVDSSDVVTSLGTCASSHGNGLVCYNNFIYAIADDNISRYGPLSGGGTAALTDAFLGTGTNDVDQSATTPSGGTYTLPTSLTEADKLSFTPTKDPIKAFIFNVSAKGAGDFTIVIHDAQNSEMFKQTFTNASISTGVFQFNFTTPYCRIQPGKAYHLHIYSSAGAATIVTTVANTLPNAYYQELFSYLVADTAYHPAITHTDGTKATMITGNGRYLSSWDDATYLPNKIPFESGYKVRDLLKINQFVAALCWKGTTIDGSEEGRIYLWDGISPYFNDVKPITGGLPNAATNFKNRIISILGSSGDINLGVDPFNKVQSAPNLARGKKIEVVPGGIDVWRSKTVIGLGTNTDDASFEQGVYEYGSQSDRNIGSGANQEVLNFGYRISTGTTQSTSMKIGVVKAFGAGLYIGWKDGSSYGMDKVSKTGDPSPVGSWESLIIDLGATEKGALKSMPLKEKLAFKVVVSYLTLPTGCTVTPKYKIDREAAWVTQTTNGGTVGTTRAECLIGGIGGKRFHELEIGFDLVATTSYPTILGVHLEWDPLPQERGDL